MTRSRPTMAGRGESEEPLGRACSCTCDAQRRRRIASRSVSLAGDRVRARRVGGSRPANQRWFARRGMSALGSRRRAAEQCRPGADRHWSRRVRRAAPPSEHTHFGLLPPERRARYVTCAARETAVQIRYARTCRCIWSRTSADAHSVTRNRATERLLSMGNNCPTLERRERPSQRCDAPFMYDARPVRRDLACRGRDPMRPSRSTRSARWHGIAFSRRARLTRPVGTAFPARRVNVLRRSPGAEG